MSVASYGDCYIIIYSGLWQRLSISSLMIFDCDRTVFNSLAVDTFDQLVVRRDRVEASRGRDA